MSGKKTGGVIRCAVFCLLGLGCAAFAQVNTITVHDTTITNTITPHMYGACMEDVNHEIYGGIYSQMVFGESFQEPSTSQIANFEAYGGTWTIAGGEASVAGTNGPKLIANNTTSADCEAGVEVNLGSNAGPSGLIMRVTRPGIGADNFYGYEIGLAPNLARIGKHENNFTLLRDIACTVPTGQWVTLRVTITGATITVYVNGTNVGAYTDASPLASGAIGLRAWLDGTTRFRTMWVNTGTGVRTIAFAAGTGQISGMWRAMQSGTAAGTYAIDAASPFKGTGSQRITFSSGTGEIGIENKGLNRQGMYFAAGRPYEGYIWARASSATPVTVALESADGATIYAEVTMTVTSATWARSNFFFTSNATGNPGRFAIKLKQAGTVTIGHAFLQPGSWGRFQDLPVRKDVGDALVAQKSTILRLGGCMAQWAGYRWKNQIGPRDQRPAVDGWWYGYCSMGWGIMDFLDFCEKAGILGIPDLNYRDSGQSVVDFVEYVNGTAASTWGARRVADGHPAPYNIKYIQFGNEERLNDGYYWPAFESTARAVWARDTNIILVVGDFGYHNVIIDPYNFTGGDGCNSLATHKKILDLAKLFNREVWFDVHIWTETLPQPTDIPALISFHNQLAAISPGARFKLVCYEFNANSHTLQRGLCNAHGINELERLGDKFMMVSSANCLQVDGQNDNGWDQGLLFMNPEKVWAQSPYYVTQMAANSYQPLCLSASISGSLGNNFDLTVTKSENGQELVIKTVNMTSGQVRSRVAFDRYAVSGKSVTITTLAGALNAANTAANPNSIVPTATTRIAGVNDTFSFPAYSYTTIQYRPATAVAAPAATPLRRFSVKSLPQGIAISLSGEAAGNTRSVTILDLRGSRVADLSAAPGSGPTFRWDRTTRQGKRAAAGSYIVSIADAKGNVTSFPIILNFR